jgi:hypothetical protein
MQHTRIAKTPEKGRTDGGISPQMNRRLQACGNEGEETRPQDLRSRSCGDGQEEAVLPTRRGDVAMVVVPVAGGQDGDGRARAAAPPYC